MAIDPLIANLKAPFMGNVNMTIGLVHEKTWSFTDDSDVAVVLTGVDSATVKIVDPIRRELIMTGTATITRAGDDLASVTVSFTASQTADLVNYCATPRGATNQPTIGPLRQQLTLFDDAGNGYLTLDLTVGVISWA